MMKGCSILMVRKTQIVQLRNFGDCAKKARFFTETAKTAKQQSASELLLHKKV